MVDKMTTESNQLNQLFHQLKSHCSRIENYGYSKEQLETLLMNVARLRVRYLTLRNYQIDLQVSRRVVPSSELEKMSKLNLYELEELDNFMMVLIEQIDKKEEEKCLNKPK